MSKSHIKVFVCTLMLKLLQKLFNKAVKGEWSPFSYQTELYSLHIEKPIISLWQPSHNYLQWFIRDLRLFSDCESDLALESSQWGPDCICQTLEYRAHTFSFIGLLNGARFARKSLIIWLMCSYNANLSDQNNY